MGLEEKELSPRGRAKRDQILGAARKLFLERGFAETSMEAIREEAGVSKPTLYNYYSGKEELFADVLRRFIDENFGDWLREEVAGGSFPATRDELRDVLMDLAERFVGTLMRPEYLALARVVVAETPRVPRLGRLFRRAVPERVIERVSALLERAGERGIAEVGDVDAAGRMFVGPLLTYVLLDGVLVGDGEASPPERRRIGGIVELYMKAIGATSE